MKYLSVLPVVAALASSVIAQQPAQQPAPKTWAQQTAGLERHDGFIPFYFDEKTGKLLFEVSRLDQDFLYLYSLSTGLGSNARGLDRGTTGDEGVVRFQRFGPRIFLVRRNLSYRATRDTVEQRTVEESFANSVLASFPILAEENRKVLIDASDFVLQDVFNVHGNLQRGQEGSFRLDRNRSAIFPARTKAFPRNTEVEVVLTFESEAPGNEVARHTPDPRALTLREHHSFVELPDDNYKPRAFDPRVGMFSVDFYDFSLPFNRRPQERWIARWRLEKKNPNAAMSDPVKPLVYYLDRGVPEPYRTAFKQGAAWWNKTFEAAGFTNAFRVEDLPDSVDPMDARYSVIQWVHRSDPGFSVGQSFVDPRTGEIIKAALKMDTYRSITDYNIFAGMEPAMDDATEAWITSLDPKINGTEFTMARRRQHIAHEIGHTLGLAHNYVSHTYGRASVMDYPGPLVTLRNGKIDVSNAWREGTGAYDTLAIRYAYTQYNSAAEEKAGLAALMRDAVAKGTRFLSDRDADAGVVPEATRWLNGNDAVTELRRQTAVRDVLLSKFDESVIAPGDPMWFLNERLVPVYLHHRYAIEAAIKAIGGMDYTFALRGDTQAPATIVDPAKQREALNALMAAIQPKELAIPERILAKIPPSPYGYRGGWTFDSPAGIVFDPLAVARGLASYVAEGILQPERVARLFAFHARNPAAPSAEEVISTMIASVYDRMTAATPYESSLRREARRAVVDALMSLASNQRATPDARAVAESNLDRLARRLASSAAADADDRAANSAVVRDTRNWLDNRIAPPKTTGVIQLPPGTPIGCCENQE
ncbi:MAG TPA: zinc-dependent metalloprotease [Gemmatimonadaceae bacterium]|nr:zinc-dependent metalloprotease [Gemmatimonadaceae bacterium]